MKRKNKFWVGDFETNSSPKHSNNLVYAWMLASNNTNNFKEYFSGISIETFINKCIEIIKNPLNKQKKLYIYFNNLVKFDGIFILKALPILGWKQRGFSKSKKELEVLNNRVLRKSLHRLENPKKRKDKIHKTYSVFTDGTKNMYSITLYWEKKQVVFNCSYKIFNCSIFKMAEIIDDKNYKKGIIDYEKQRHYKDNSALKNDKMIYSYLKQDCDILLKFLVEVDKIFPKNKWGLTTGAMAVKAWQLSLLDKMIKIYKPEIHVINNITNYKKYAWRGKMLNQSNLLKKLLNEFLNIESLNQVHNGDYIFNHLSKAYKGGLTFSSPFFQGLKLDKCVSSWDINSAYPYHMTTKNFPYGAPYLGDGGKKYPLKIYEIKILGELNNKFGIRFIGQKTFSGVYMYAKTLKQQTIYLCDAEYLRFQKYYLPKKNYKAKIVYSFKAVKGDWLFGDYINKWYRHKKDKNKYLQTISKLMMNSLYGKMASKNLREIKIYNPEKWDGYTSFEIDEVLEKSSYYLPIGIWITAYTRCQLIDGVGRNYKYFIYCDTDSLYMLNKYQPNFNISNELGDWKQETFNSSFISFGKKKYMVIKDDKVIKHSFNSFHINKDHKIYKDYNYCLNVLEKGLKNIQIQKKESQTGYIFIKQEKVLSSVWDKRYVNSPERWFWDKDSYTNNKEKQEKKIECLLKN